MSKQAIALLQAERDHVASAGRDFGGRLSDEDSSTVAEYDDAIAAVQKLMARLERLEKGPQAAEIAKACWEFGQASGGAAYRNAFWDGVRFTEEWISKTTGETA